MSVLTEPRSTSPSMRNSTLPVSSSMQRTDPSLHPAKSIFSLGWYDRQRMREPEVGMERLYSSTPHELPVAFVVPAPPLPFSR